jgi:multicomponent Na+:H+ antiporter subunit F
VETGYLALSVVMLLALAGGIWRVVIGPKPADRMQAALLLGTTGVALLLLLGEATGQPPLRDVALMLALLAAVAAVAFVRRAPAHPGEDRGSE